MAGYCQVKKIKKSLIPKRLIPKPYVYLALQKTGGKSDHFQVDILYEIV